MKKMIINNVFNLKKLFEESEQFLQTQWYRRYEALRYELEDLKKMLDMIGQYDDEFTTEEMRIYTECEKEYNELLKEYEEGDIAC